MMINSMINKVINEKVNIVQLVSATLFVCIFTTFFLQK